MNQHLLNVALSQVGIREIVGSEDNPEVLKYFNEIGFDGRRLKDETAWCSAFMNWVAKECNAEYTKQLNARSWLKVGQEVITPKMGDVVVLWRESKSSWKGHVGLYICERDGYIYVLGGNQKNKVGINAYHSNRLLGYRRL
jgi:uncharacterized protein (TIGR02594 family)